MDEGFANDYRAKRLRNYDRFQSWIEGHETLARWASAFLFAALLGGLAQISFQTVLSPVPFTMQVFGVSLMGGILGRKWGTISALLYIALGLVGLPMYAGQVAQWDGFHPFGGLRVFTTAASAWYLVGFVAYAYIVGLVADRRSENRTGLLVGFAPLAIAGLLVFVLLDAYFLADYRQQNPTNAFPNAWFILLTLGMVVVVGAAAWLALTRKARRERIELVFANLVGLLALLAIGSLGFAIMWKILGNGPLTLRAWLAYTILPFIPVDVLKILAAVGLQTLVRPTSAELATRGGGTSDV